MDTIVKNAKVNAPLDKTIWLQADWGKVNHSVRRIQNRIVKAVKANDWRKERWNTHHILEKIKGGSDKLSNLVLLHPYCHKQLHSCLKAGLHIQTSPSHA